MCTWDRGRIVRFNLNFQYELTRAGYITGADVSIRSVTGSFTAVNTVDATNSITIRANNGITSTTLLNAPTLSLTSDTGNIGTSPASRLQLSSSTQNFSAVATLGSVYARAPGAINLLASSAGNTFDFLSIGNMTVSGAVSAPTTVLNSSGGSILLTAAVTGTTSATLSGQNGISGSVSAAVNGATVNLTSALGSIGVNTAQRLKIDADNLQAQAFTSVFLSDSDDVTVNAASSAGQQFDLLAVGALSSTAAGTISADAITLRSTGSSVTLGGDLIGASSINLRASTNLTNNASTLAATNITLRSDTGSIGTSGTRFAVDATNLVANTPGGDVYISDASDINLGSGISSALGAFDVLATGNITSTGSVSAGSIVLRSTAGTFGLASPLSAVTLIDLRSFGSISSSSITGTLAAAQVNLRSDSGSIGASGSRLSIDADNLSLTASNGSIYLNELNSVNITSATTSAGGTFDLLAAGDITSSGAITANSAVLRTTGGAFSLGGAINATNVSLRSATGITNANVAGGINANANVTLIVDTGNIGTSAASRFTVDANNLTAVASNGSVYISDVDAVNFVGNSSATGTFDVVSGTGGSGAMTSTGNISGNVVVLRATGAGFSLGGSVTGSTSVSLRSGIGIVNADISGGINSNQINLTADTGNIGTNAGSRLAIDTVNLTANATAGSVFISDANSLNLGSGASGALNTFDVTANSLTVNGALAANSILLSTTAGGSGNIQFTAPITSSGGGNSVSISADGSISGVGVVTGATVSLTATNGSVGSSGTHVLTNAATLAVNALNGSAYVNDSATNVSLNASGAQTFDLSRTSAASGGITLTGALQGTDVTLRNTAGNGAITLSNPISGIGGGNANTVNLIATGSGNISGASAVSTNSLTMTGGSGNFSTIGTNAQNIAFSTTGDVIINDTRTGSVNLNTSNAANATVNLTTANSSLVVAGPVSATTNLTLTTAGTGNISRSGAGSILTAGGLLTLTAGGNVGASGTSMLTDASTIAASAGAGRSIFIAENDLVTLNTISAGNAVNITAGGDMTINNITGNSVTLGTTNGGNITRNSGTITAPTLVLTSDFGTIGNGGAITTTANNISATTAGNITVSSSNVGTTNFGAVSGNAVSLTTTGAMNLSQDVSGATSVSLNTTNSNITQTAGKTISTSSLSMTSGSGSVGTNVANITTNATNLTVTTGTAGSVFVHGTNSLNLNASSGGNFSLIGDGSINQTGLLTTNSGSLSTTANGNIALNNVASFAGTLSLVVTANGSGSITRNGGTIGASASNVTLSSGSGAIGTSGNRIQIAGGTTIANTSGNVYLQESAGSQVSGSATASGSTFDVLATAGGIDLNGPVTAGSIVAAANAGQVSVNGLLTSSSTVALTAGNNQALTVNQGVIAPTSVTLTAQGNGNIVFGAGGVLTTNTLNATSGSGVIGQTNSVSTNAQNINVTSTSGNINIKDTFAGTINLNTLSTGNAASIVFNTTGANNVINTIGTVQGGNLTLAAQVGSNGSVSLNSSAVATNAAGNLILTANGTGTIAGSGSANGTNVTLNSGTGNIGSSGQNLNTSATNLVVNSSGSAFINELNAVTLNASTANSYQLTAGGTITVSGAISAGNVNLQSNGGNIALGANIQGLSGAGSRANSISLGASGAGTITRTGAFTLFTNNLSVTSGSGNIGVGGTGGNLLTNALAITGSTTGDLSLSDNATSTVSLNSITGNNVTVANTGAGGAMAINAAVNGTTSLTLSTTGGAISRTGGASAILSGGALSLTAAGNIGSAATPILTSVSSIAANSTVAGSNIYLSESDAVTLNSSGSANVNSFNLTAGGALLLNDLQATTANLATTNGGSISRNGATSINATDLNLTSDFGNIGALGLGNNITTSALNVSANTSGNVFINDTGNNANLLASKGNIFSFTLTRVTAGAGVLTLVAPLNANSVTLATGSNNSAIALNNTINGLLGGDATSVSVNANGSGNISTTGALISTTGLTLSSTSGNIGQGTAINTNADNLQATTSAAGSVNVADTGSVNLLASVAGNFNLTAAGNVTILGALQTTNGTIATTNNGNITQNAVIQGVGGGNATSVTLNAGGSGNVTQTAGAVATASLNLISGSGTIGTGATPFATNAATLSANTTGNVNVNDNLGAAVSLLASSGNSFKLVTAAALNINGALTVGSADVSSTGGSIVVNAPINASGSVLLTVSAGQTISNVAAGTISSGTSTTLTSSTGAITVGGAINAGTSVNINTTTGAQNLNAAISGNVVNLNGTGSAIDINTTITGTTAINIAVTTGQVSGNAGSLLSTNTLTMNATTGGLGQNGSIITNAANVSAVTTGLAVTQSDVDLTLTRVGVINVTNLAGNDVNVLATGAGSVLSLGLVNSGGDVVVTSQAGTNGSLVLNNNISAGGLATDTFALTADGIGTITRTGGVLSGNVLSLVSGSGDIGTSANRIQTNVTTLTANTTGNVYINEANAVGINSSVAGNFNLTAGGTVTINNNQVLQSNNTTIQAGAILNDGIIRGIGGAGTRANSVSLTAIGAGTITRNGATDVINTNALTLNSGSGNIGSAAGPNAPILTDATSITASTFGDVTISDSSATTVSLNSVSGDVVAINLTTSSTGMNIAGPVSGITSVALSTTGAGANINRTNIAGLISGPTVTLTSGGSIGTSGNRINTAADTLTTIANSAGANVFVSEADAVTIGTTSSANATFDLIAGGSVTLNNLSGNSVKLAVSNGGDITSNAGTSITANTLNVTSDTGSIGVSTSAASISGSTLGDLSITDSNLGLVNVGTLSGSAVSVNTAAGMNLLQNVSGQSSVALTAGGAGNITQVAGRIIQTALLSLNSTSGNIGAGSAISTNASTVSAGTSGTVSINDAFAGAVVLNALSGSTTTFNANGVGSSLVINGPVTGTNTNLATGPTTNGNVVINGNVNVSGVANISADGTGSISNPNGVVTAGTANLTSASGNIGTFAKYVQVDAANMSANTTGNVFVENTHSTGINLGTSAGSNFNVKFSSDLTVGGSGITGNTVNLTANVGTGAGVILNNTGITGTTSVAIHADGAGTISEIGGPITLINTPTVVLTSGSGDIGAPALPIYINATNVTATTTGGIYLNNINNGPVNLGPLSGYDFFYTNNGTINVVGILDFTHDVSLLTNNNGSINVNATIIAGNSLTLQAGGIGNITQASGTLLDTPTLVATSGGGNIGTSVNHITTNASTLTVNTGGLGSAWVDDINSIQNILLVGQNGAGQTFNLTVAGGPGLYVTTGAGIVQANTANITSLNGSIGNLALPNVVNPLVTKVTNLNVNAAENIYVVNDDGVVGADNLNVTGASASGNIVIAANGNLTTSGVVSGGEVVLGALNGALDINAAVNAVTQLGLLSNNATGITDANFVGGSLNASTIAFVELQGDINLTLNGSYSPSLVNAAFDADQGTVNVVASGLPAGALHLQDVTFSSLTPLGSGLDTATNQSNGYSVSNAGNLFVDGSVDSGTGSTGLTTSLGGAITVTGTGSINSGAQVNVFASGAVQTDDPSTVTGVGLVNLNGSSVTVNGSATSTSGQVSLQANTGDVTVGSNGSVIGNAAIGTAVNLTSNLGSVVVDGNIDGVATVDIQASQNFTAGLNSTIDSSAANVSILASNGTSTIDGSVGALTTASVVSGGTNTVTGSVSSDTTTIQSTGADLQISGNLTGSTAINLSSNDDLLNANILGGTFTTPQFNLTSTAGSIGASGDALDLQATVNVNDPLSMTANAFTDVYVTYDGSALTIGGGKSSANGVFDVANTVGSITTTGAIDPTVVNITSATSIDINSVVSASDAINLNAGTDINTDAALGSLQTPGILTATSTGGDIGTNLVRLNTQVGTIALSAVNGEAYVDNTNLDLTVNASTALGDLCINTEGTMTVAGTVTANAISLLATTASVSLQGDVLVQAALNTTGVDTIVDIDADRDIITSGLGTISANLIVGTAGRDITIGAAVTGDNNVVHSALSSVTFSTAGGNFSANDTVSGNQVDISAETIQLNALVSGTGAGNVVSLTAENSITAANINGQISAETLNLTSTTGDIGALGAEILTAVQNLSMNSTLGDAYAINNGDVNLLASSANGTLSLATNGSLLGGAITVTGAVTGFDVVLAAQNGSLFGNLNLNATVTANNNLDLDADNDVTSNASGVLQGRFVNINGVNSVTLNAAVTSTGPANTLDVLSNGAIATNVGAVLSGATINVQSSNSTVVIGEDVTGTGAGSVVTITASGASPNGSVTTNAGADITGHTISVTSTNDSLVLNGTIDSTGAVGNSVSLSAFNDITAANVANVSAESLSLTSTNGSVGTDFGANQVIVSGVTNLTVNAANDAFIRFIGDLNLVGTNSAGNGFNIASSGSFQGGSLDIQGTVTSVGFFAVTGGTDGGNITVSSTGNVTSDFMNIFAFGGGVAVGDVTVAGSLNATNGGIQFDVDNDITTTGTGVIGANFILFDALGAINVTTQTGGVQVLADNATIVNRGDLDLQSATVTNTLDVSTDATIGGDITVSGAVTADVVNITANAGPSSTPPGNITLTAASALTGTTSVSLNADGSIVDDATITTNNLSLTAAGGDIGSSSNFLEFQQASGTDVNLTINAGTFDSYVRYVNSGTVHLLGSGGDELNLATRGLLNFGAGALLSIDADSTFSGDINLTTNNITNAASVLSSTNGDINIASFTGQGLSFNGGVGLVGGTYSAVNGLISVTATANDLDLNGTNTFASTVNMYATGSGQSVNLNATAYEVANAPSFIFTPNFNFNGGQLIDQPGPWNIVNSVTDANSPGNLTLTGTLNYGGSNLAIIASGNIILDGVTIDLNGNDGGNLTMLAGYTFNPPNGTNGVPVFNDGVTLYQNFAVAGAPGSIQSINGDAVITSTGATGSGGNVLLAATGTITVGSITTTGAVNGGTVTVIGAQGVTVGAVTTTGGTADGNVTLAVADPVVSNDLQIQAGTVIQGSIGLGVTPTLGSGDLVAGVINAGSAAVSVYGANNFVTVVNQDTIDLTAGVNAGTLSITSLNGTVDVTNSTIGTLNVAMGAGTGTVTVSNSGTLLLDNISANSGTVDVTSTGLVSSGTSVSASILDVTGGGIDFTNGATATNMFLTSTGGNDIIGSATATTLDLDSSGNVGTGTSARFSTNSTDITVDAIAGAFLDVTSASANTVTFNSGIIGGAFDVLASNDANLATATANTITAGSVVLDTDGTIGTAAVGGEFRITDGGAGVGLALTQGTSSTAFVNYTGSNTVTLNASSGGALTLRTASGSVATGGDSTFDDDINITTNSMTNANHITSTNGDINIQSNAASGLALIGGVGPVGGQYEAQNGLINITATANNLTIDNVTTYVTAANLFANGAGQGVVLNAGSDSIATVPSFIFTSNLTGTGTLTNNPGPWNVVSSGTFSENPGDLTINGLTVVGGNIALLARGSIILNGNIDLSGVSGGSLTMIAGFDYTPTGSFSFDNANQFANFTNAVVGTGNISVVGSSNINLSGTTGNGGTLIALANNGSVTLNNVNTSSASAAGGAVTIIAENGITVADVTTTGGTTSGNVALTIGTPTVGSGTTFTIQGGAITNGANTIASTGATAGDMAFGNINAGTATVTLTGALTNGADDMTGTGLITASTLNLNTGAGVAQIGNTDIDTINSTATGASTVSLSNTGNLDLGTLSGATATLDLATSLQMTNAGGGAINVGPITLTADTFNLAGTTLGTAGASDITIRSTNTLSGSNLGTINGFQVRLVQTASMTDPTITNGVTATNLTLRTTGTGSNIGTSTSNRFVLQANQPVVTAISDLGSVFLTTALPSTGTLTVSGSAGGTNGNFDVLGTGNINVRNISTVDGDINIVTPLNRITVAPGAVLSANGVNAGNGDIFLRVDNTTNTAKKTSFITILNGAQLLTNTPKVGDGVITLSLGVLQPLTPGKQPKKNVIVNLNGGTIFWGKKSATYNAPVTTLTAQGTNIVFNNPLGKNISIQGAIITADPPVAAGTQSYTYVAPNVAAAAPASAQAVEPMAMPEAHQTLFGFDTNNSMVTSDLSVLNLNAAPQLQAANNSTLMTATNTASLAAQAGMTVANGAVNTGMSGLASVVRTSSIATADEDNSYMVGFMGNSVGETEAAICSDAEIGMTEGAAQGVQAIQHSDRVVIKKGNVLFVPFKATTVETPNGIVHIDAKSVALVSSTDAGLAVYDLEDQHKGSVSVESNGHNVVLSPGRHVMVTKHHTAEFAQINAVETIAHRNVQSTVKNGHRAHTSEFSVLTAMDTVKPLKALAMSKHANAKHIADRMLKTTAIILQIGGASGQYQHYFKPRMTAMQK